MKEVVMPLSSSIIKNDMMKEDLKKDCLLLQSNSIYENNNSEMMIYR